MNGALHRRPRGLLPPAPSPRFRNSNRSRSASAGDSGDGMQLAGTQFTNASAILGNDISTLPDFPAEIRAPAGTLAGVSGFQVHFSQPRHPHARRPARHAGRDEPGRAEDQPQGPGAGRHPDRQLRRLRHQRPAQGRLQGQPARGRLARRATGSSRCRSPSSTARPSPRSSSARARPTAARTSSPWAWSTGSTSGRWSRRCSGSSEKFGKNPAVLEANTRTLKAGYNYGETTEALPVHYRVRQGEASRRARYRKITGNEALAIGLVAAAKLAEQAAGLRQLPDHAGQRHPAPAGRAEAASACGRSRPRTRSPPSAWPSAPRSAAPSASPAPAARASA